MPEVDTRDPGTRSIRREPYVGQRRCRPLERQFGRCRVSSVLDIRREFGHHLQSTGVTSTSPQEVQAAVNASARCFHRPADPPLYSNQPATRRPPSRSRRVCRCATCSARRHSRAEDLAAPGVGLGHTVFITRCARAVNPRLAAYGQPDTAHQAIAAAKRSAERHL